MKKRQVVVIQLKEEDLEINEKGEVVGKIKTSNLMQTNLMQTSGTHILRQLEKIEIEKGVHTSIDKLNKRLKKKNARLFKADSLVKFVSLEFGKVNKNNEELIEKCIKNGFKLSNLNMKFLGAVGGSGVKKLKQFYVQKEVHEEITKRINLKELKHCITPKRLTSNALMTTAIWEIPYDLSKLNVCILPDNEIEKVFKDKLETLIPYEYENFTDEEKQKYDNFTYYQYMIKRHKELTEEYKKGELQNLETKINYNENKTPSRWLNEDNRLVKEGELEKPYKSAKGRLVYNREQTVELEHNIFEVAEWSLGYKVIDYNGKLPINNFDGFGLLSLELGDYIRNYMKDNTINGCQLRIPQMKGFYIIIDFKQYFKEHKIKFIYDRFGHKWSIDDIDILATESTFKSKIETDETGENKKWMWKSYQEYRNSIVENGYDCIGVANYTHRRNINEYRTLTYQFLEALNATEYDLLALASEHGKMLYNVLKIYRENREKGQEINWEDIKYIKCYIQNLLEEKNIEDDEAEYVATALKCINLNKYMIFDKKFTDFLSKEIERELNQLSLGQIKVKSNYLYVTTDIIGFLRYASQFSNDKCEDEEYRKELSSKEIKGVLGENQWFCEGIIGNKVMYRNPMMAQAEIFKPVFVDLSTNEDYKYIKHLDNIIQAPMSTYCFQKATFDVDGDKMQLIHLDHNLKDYNLDWLINYNFINEVVQESENDEEIKIELNNLDRIKEQMSLYFDIRFEGKEVVTLADLIFDNNKIIVNPSDGETVKGEEWNIDNIYNFLVNSEDKTGIITDFNTTALNQLNSLACQDFFTEWFKDIYEKYQVEDKFRDYKFTGLNEGEFEIKKQQLKLTNKYCKFFQGIIIDMSKRGGTVEIAEMLNLIYKKKPQFYTMKGKEKNSVDRDFNSHIDRFYKKMQGLNKTIKKLFGNKIRENISNHSIYFTPKLIQNSKINNNVKLKEIQEQFKKLIEIYSEENIKLINEKKNINKFSKDDVHKEARMENRLKFRELALKTKEEAKKVCENDLVLAQALYQHVYNSDDSKAFSYAWTVAEKGFIYNLQNNQSEKYNVGIAEKEDENTFEYFGEKYKLTISNEEIEYYKEGDMNLDNLEDFMIDTNEEKIENVKLLFVANKQHYQEDKENYVVSLLENITDKEFILKEKNGFVQLADDKNILIGINSKGLDYSDVDIPNRADYKIKFKEIERLYSGKDNNKKLNRTSFNAVVDLYK